MGAAEFVVTAPFSGRVVELRDVPDEVFAGEVLGPGLAIWPTVQRVPVLAPVAGELTAWHPHACGIMSLAGPAVLVHLGIDTVRLQGRGFSWRVARGAQLGRGQLICTWDTSRLGNLLPVTPVILMSDVKLTRLAGAQVRAGEPLFSVPEDRGPECPPIS